MSTKEFTKETPYCHMTPTEIDEMVLGSHGVIRPIYLEIEPWSTSAISIFSLHGGAQARVTIDKKGETVALHDYRYHR